MFLQHPGPVTIIEGERSLLFGLLVLFSAFAGSVLIENFANYLHLCLFSFRSSISNYLSISLFLSFLCPFLRFS